MKTPKIGINFFYNLLFNISNLLFPLITFVYVVRIIGPVGIGKVNFANAIVTYFMIFSCIGIPLYGVREIAKVNSDKNKLSRLFSELLAINFFSVVICSLVFLSMFLFVPQVRQDIPLFLISGFVLVFSFLSIDWVFSGLENYKYISIRNIAIKIATIILVFIFVKKPEDYILFALINVVSILLNYILNIIFIRKYILIQFRNLDFSQHLKSLFILFTSSIAISLYYTLNPIIIGFLSSMQDVGYFTSFNKIVQIASSLIGAYIAVVYPRFTIYLQNKDTYSFNDLSRKSISFVSILAFPIIVLFFIFGQEIVLLIAGKDFVSEVAVLLVICPVLYFSNMSLLLQSQIILPNKLEKKLIIPPIIGAILNIGLGIFFLKIFGLIGIGFAFMAAEIFVFIFILMICKKIENVQVISKNIFMYLVVSVLLAILFFFLKKNLYFNNVIMVFESLLYLGIYFSILFFLGEPNIQTFIRKIANIMHKKTPN